MQKLVLLMFGIALFGLGAAVGERIYEKTMLPHQKGHVVCPYCHKCLGHIDTIVTSTTVGEADVIHTY